MKVNRRTSVRILAGAAAASRVALAQPAAPQPAKQLETARGDLRDAAQRIARVKLPRTTEPAFRFRA